MKREFCQPLVLIAVCSRMFDASVTISEQRGMGRISGSWFPVESAVPSVIAVEWLSMVGVCVSCRSYLFRAVNERGGVDASTPLCLSFCG